MQIRKNHISNLFHTVGVIQCAESVIIRLAWKELQSIQVVVIGTSKGSVHTEDEVDFEPDKILDIDWAGEQVGEGVNTGLCEQAVKDVRSDKREQEMEVPAEAELGEGLHLHDDD